MGNIGLSLDETEAPKTVANFQLPKGFTTIPLEVA